LAIEQAAAVDPGTFRLAHYSVQHDHVHLIVEARDARALSGGVRSVAIRIARYVNELLSCKGTFWAERWHGRALSSPREVRNAILYVLANFRKHGRRPTRAGIDPCSSGAYFDGWRGWAPDSGMPPPYAQRPPRGIALGSATQARTWLARRGWRRHGLIGLDEAPRASP
jgi:hypothetical protein